MYNLKLFNMILIFSIFVFNIIHAGCGSCPGDIEKVVKKPLIKKKSNALIMNVPKNGNISGIVIVSCEMCNFGINNAKSCNLNIKIGNNVFPAKGTKINDYGNPNCNEEFCNAVRVAYTNGKIEKGIFYADSFTLIKGPNQN